MATERQPFDFGNLLNQVSAQSAPYVMQANRGLYGMFPQTARAASGYTGTGMMTPAMLRKGAMGVSTMGITRFPLAQGFLQTVSGDPIGGAGTAIGGFAGAKLGAKAGIPFAKVTGGLSIPVGALVGGLIGAGTGQSATRGLAGIDINDPYSGPDISIPIFGGIPITPAAKTKKSRQRMREERMKDVEAMAPYMRQQFAMDMMSQQNAQSAQLMGNIISNSRR